MEKNSGKRSATLKILTFSKSFIGVPFAPHPTFAEILLIQDSISLVSELISSMV
jgi:hypothetical protein